VEEKGNRWVLLAKDAAFDGLREEARRENEASGVEDGGGSRNDAKENFAYHDEFCVKN
jgi:hypothetical protein